MDKVLVNATALTVGVEENQSEQQTVATQNSAGTDKAVRFKDRAESQTSKVMAEMEKLQKLSNKKYYNYTPEQIAELFGALQTALDEAKATFTSDTVEKKKLFTFSA